MITIVLTYRDRALRILENCLKSLKNQTNQNFKVMFVDFGSTLSGNELLKELLSSFSFITYYRCETQEQLWCKSRAINIALKQCYTDFLFVGDIDMIFHKDFIEKLYELKANNKVIYFQVGFLNENESKLDKNFEEYDINFRSTHEATGMTLYNVQLLKSINGYDEFYNGWGSEDTDVHVRLENLGCKIKFYDEKILLLHQWHPKNYRTTKSLAPFHSTLERLNSQYLSFVSSTKKTKANLNFDWGVYNVSDYSGLNQNSIKYKVSNKEHEFKAFVNNVLLQEKDKVISVLVSEHHLYRALKLKLKRLLKQKTPLFLSMQQANDYLLEIIIMNLRNNAYKFHFNTNDKTIQLTIKL